MSGLRVEGFQISRSKALGVWSSGREDSGVGMLVVWEVGEGGDDGEFRNANSKPLRFARKHELLTPLQFRHGVGCRV